MFSAVVSIIHWILALIILVTLCPVGFILWLVTYPFDKKIKVYHYFTSLWGIILIRINPLLRIKVHGREKLDHRITYVIACNHQSLLDIAVIYNIWAYFKWVAKKELFNVPILGWTMRMNKYVKVDRGNKVSHLKMMKECEDYLKTGVSIMIFPEGTRSENGQIQNFKDGAFIMAKNTRTPILPIIIDGTAEAIPKNGLFFKKLSNITIHILDPLDAAQYDNITVKELNNKVKDIMVVALAEIRKGMLKN